MTTSHNAAEQALNALGQSVTALNFIADQVEGSDPGEGIAATLRFIAAGIDDALQALDGQSHAAGAL